MRPKGAAYDRQLSGIRLAPGRDDRVSSRRENEHARRTIETQGCRRRPRATIIEGMSLRALCFVLLCLATALAGMRSLPAGASQWASTAFGAASVIEQGELVHQPVMTAVADEFVDCDQDDGDNDGCADGHCKHRCVCGCGMGACASPSMAVSMAFFTLPGTPPTEAIAAPVAYRVTSAYHGSLLRPPIA